MDSKGTSAQVPLDFLNLARQEVLKAGFKVDADAQKVPPVPSDDDAKLETCDKKFISIDNR